MPVAAEPVPGALRRRADGAALALAFLTTLPVRLSPSAVSFGDAAPWFPVVGLLVGGAAGGVRAAADSALGPLPASVLALVALVALTGALHQDGLADCADAAGARGGGTARRLEVMRDPATGTFGTLALLLWALLLVSALAGLDAADAVAALVAAAALGRWAALVHAAAAAPARRDGLGASFAPGRGALATSTLLAAAAAAALLGPAPATAAAFAALATALLTAHAARRLLGGRTGDTLGATVALAEVAVCLVALAAA